jgi:hypothetical protein
MTRTTKNSQLTPRGKQAAAAAAAPAAAAAAPAAAKQNFVVAVKQEATTGGGEEKKGETKYHCCSTEELLNKLLENREQLKALQKIRTKGKNGKKKGTAAKLCNHNKDHRLKIKSKVRELTELGLELRKRGMGRPSKQRQCDAFVFDTDGDASLLKLLGGSDQSHDAPACKHNSSGRVVVQPIAFEGLELDASCFRRTCLLELAALAGVKPQVIYMIMWRVAHLSHTL